MRFTDSMITHAFCTIEDFIRASKEDSYYWEVVRKWKFETIEVEGFDYGDGFDCL